ncbi:Protein regulator of cytokinesis 1 [Nymphon striatum]|nr:Protein regulator of cytokinesis 1 [Nymphon striatum]
MSASRIKDLKIELGEKFHAVMEKLSDIWTEIGICESKRDERLKVVMQHLETLLEEMLAEEDGLKSRLLTSVKNCTEEVLHLCQQLTLPQFVPEEGLTILQLECKLRKQVEELSRVQRQRIERFNELTEREAILCQCLAVPQLTFSESNVDVPSIAEMDELEQHVIMLSDEKTKRQEQFHTMKLSIESLMSKLEYSPTTQLECDLVCEDKNSFTLSSEHVQNVTELLVKLQKLENDYIQEAETLRKRLDVLWDRLDIDKAERDQFSILNSGYKPSVIHAIKNEIHRCEDLKRQNMKLFILKMRDELDSWWNKCFISQEQRDKFDCYYDDNFTEKLLNLHEFEVEKLKDYYELNKELLQKVAKREELWKTMIQFEKNAMDPKRFNNRGGGLLQEELERKKLLTRLPKLEKELETLIEEWEAKEGREFFVNGMRFLNYIAMQWEQHRQEKENEKLERKRIRAKQIENEANGIKSHTSTPHLKRVANNTPSSTPKRLRTFSVLTPKTNGKETFSTPAKKVLPSAKRTPSYILQEQENIYPVIKEPKNVEDSGFSVTTVSEMPAKERTLTSSMASYTEFTIKEKVQQDHSHDPTGLKC